MNIQKISQSPNFYSTQNTQKREFIDVITDNVRNPSDVNDCVAVPRGIFKAYIYLMGGSALMSIANFLPQKAQYAKRGLNILGAILGFISAIYFAKPFALKGLSQTVQREDFQKRM